MESAENGSTKPQVRGVEALRCVLRPDKHVPGLQYRGFGGFFEKRDRNGGEQVSATKLFALAVASAIIVDVIFSMYRESVRPKSGRYKWEG